jgi:hypothetical protein
MDEQELRVLINELGINQDTIVQITYSENNTITEQLYQINFFTITGLPAIQDGRIGVRVQRIIGAAFQPVVNGIEIAGITQIILSN